MEFSKTPHRQSVWRRDPHIIASISSVECSESVVFCWYHECHRQTGTVSRQYSRYRPVCPPLFSLTFLSLQLILRSNSLTVPSQWSRTSWDTVRKTPSKNNYLHVIWTRLLSMPPSCCAPIFFSNHNSRQWGGCTQIDRAGELKYKRRYTIKWTAWCVWNTIRDCVEWKSTDVRVSWS